jgi:hypothetical protein
MGSEVTPAVDSFPLGANAAIAELIREIVRNRVEFDYETYEEEGLYANWQP